MIFVSRVHCVNESGVCPSAGLYCRWRETDEEAAGGERDGAEDRPKSSVHLHRVSMDQRSGNWEKKKKKTHGGKHHENN